MVTGVLPIALGRACKLTGFFLGHDKEYVGVMRVHKEKGLEELQEIIDEKFIGKIKQLPPRKSRVKRQEREREIKRFELIEQNEKDFLFIAEVQGGTYIRKLISDLGDLIGGAHMAELRRVRAGIFSEPAVSLYDFEKAVNDFEKGDESALRNMLVPAEGAIKKIMPVVSLESDSEAKKLLTGKPLFKEVFGNLDKIQEGEHFAVFNREKFIEVARRVENGEIIGKPEFVFN
jgi:tRNA U55 pseudouridine synthase TruB